MLGIRSEQTNNIAKNYIAGEYDTSTSRETRSLRIQAKPYGIDRHYGYKEQTSSRDPIQGVWNDFALVELSQEIDFLQHPHIRPVCLPDKEFVDYRNETGTVIGWGNKYIIYEEKTLQGLVKGRGLTNADILQKLDVR